MGGEQLNGRPENASAQRGGPGAEPLRTTSAAVRSPAHSAPLRWLSGAWSYLRAVSGDDAYERYVAHHVAEHPDQPLMSRKEYFAERQRQKWTGVTRCC